MSYEPLAVLAVLAAVFLAFLRDRWAPDLVAMAGVSVLLLAGILTTKDVLAVFSNSAPLTVAAMFVLSAALERTGVIEGMGRLVNQVRERTSPAVAIVGLLGGAMALSAFMNNTPIVVLLTPVVIGLSQSMDIAPSRMLIPLSYAAILGGTCTLVGTSTNIIVDGVAQAQGLAPFTMFEITGAGLIMASVGGVYLAIAGRWLLPDRDTVSRLLPDAARRRFLSEVAVPEGSPLVGQSLAEGGFRETRGIRVVDLLRDGMSFRDRLDTVTLQAGDHIVLRTRMGDMLALHQDGRITMGHRETAERADEGDGSGNGTTPLQPLETRETTIVEGIVGPHSRLAGRVISDLGIRRLYGVHTLAVHRHGENMGTRLSGLRLRFGDTLLVEGPAQGLSRMFASRDLINLTTPSQPATARRKAPLALAALAVVMVLAALEIMPIAGLAIIGAVAVIALGCVEPEEAYRSIHWPVLMLIFGMLAIGTAMEKTGAAAVLVGGVADMLRQFGPLVVLSMLYLITSILTEVMSNNAAAILLTPLAAGLATELGVDPRPFVVAVMFAASASFATPIGYQTNTFVHGAGGYRFMDFVKVGVPMNLLMWGTATVVIPLFWPL